MRNDIPAHLRSILTAGEDQCPEETGLPDLGDDGYRPYGRPSNQPLFTVHFISPQGNVRSFQYMHLDSDSTFSPEQISLRFMGTKAINVVIAGRNLWKLYSYLHQHRLAWVREAARDFADDRQSIVTNVAFIDSNDRVHGNGVLDHVSSPRDLVSLTEDC